MSDTYTLKEYTEEYFKQYPRRKKPPLDSPLHPSINKWFIMKRPQMNDLKQKWKDYMTWLVKKNGYENLQIGECDVYVSYWKKTRRRNDPDNLSPKFALDGIVESGMLIDDSDEYIKHLIIGVAGVDRDNPRMEFEFREL